MNRHSLLRVAAGLATAAFLPMVALAQDYPTKTIKLIVPFPPAGTPKAIVDKLNAEANKALGRPEMIEKLKEDGSTPLGGTPQQFADFIKSEMAKWGAVVRDAGIKLD